MRLFASILSLALLALVGTHPGWAGKNDTHSTLKLVSPNGKCWIQFVASDIGAAIYLSDNEGKEQRHASLVTRGDSGGDPVLSLHRDLRGIKGGFDAALSAQKDGGYLQLMHDGKPFIFTGKDLAKFKNPAGIGRQKPQDDVPAFLSTSRAEKAGGCRCGSGGVCLCGPACDCFADTAKVVTARR